MAINQLFPDNVLASTDLTNANVPGLDGAGANGPISTGVTLDVISEHIHINLFDGLVTASHSRPSMFAHIFSFANNVKQALETVSAAAKLTGYADYARLEECVKQDFIEWQGMVAAIALNNIYSGNGLNLSVKTIDLNAEDLLHKCILREMDKGGCYKDAVNYDVHGIPDTGTLYYICQNGEPFALFHPEIGLCAMKNYDASIFDGILPWYKPGTGDCHKAWHPVALPGEASMMNDFCLSRIEWWVRNLSVAVAAKNLLHNSLRNYAGFINTKLNDSAYTVNAALKASTPIINAVGIDAVSKWNGIGQAFGTTMMFYRDENGVAGKLPMLFLDSMMLTPVESNGQNKLVYNSSTGSKPLCFEGNPEALEKYAPVAPFRKDMVALLGSCHIEEMVVKPYMVDHKLDSIEVQVTMKTRDNEVFALSKRYSADNLTYGVLPYMMVWPHMAMPTNPVTGESLWKNYYATWQSRDGCSYSPLETTGNTRKRKLEQLDFDFENQAMARKILRVTAPHETAWTVCNGSAPFRYSLLKGREDENKPEELMGLIFVPEYPSFKNGFSINNDPVKLAVDFGTTSTVVGLRHTAMNTNKSFTLPFRDYSKTVTCEDAETKRYLAENQWLGNSEGGADWFKDGKLFSVAQLFNRLDGSGPNRNVRASAQEQDYYVDGRLFLLTSGGPLAQIASKMEGNNDPLRSQHIMNDMKFGDKLDTKNVHAASVYLAGIYMYAVLYLLHEKWYPNRGPFMELRISYPNAVTKNALSTGWRYARDILNKVMDPVLTEPIEDMLSDRKFYSEATAASAYFADVITPAKAMVSVDIGGGTTDISISRKHGKQEISNLSVRYAGREMMVTSLIQSFRRFPADSLLYWKDFQNLWETDEPALWQQFERLCHTKKDARRLGLAELQNLVNNSSVRMNVELMLAGGMKFKHADADSYRFVRQLIAFKFFMLMRIVARKVGENLQLWNNPITERLDAPNNTLKINMTINGTSSLMLQYIFNCDMNDLVVLSTHLFPGGSDMKKCWELLNELFTSELRPYLDKAGYPEVNAQLVISVDAEAQKKQQVCFGMLTDGIDRMKAVVVPEDDMEETERDAAVEQMQLKLANYDAEILKTYVAGKDGEKGMIDYLKEYEKVFFPNAFNNACYGLGVKTQNISDLLEKCWESTSWDESRGIVEAKRAMYMVEKEQENYMDLLACMYLVEEIIDREMAIRQV